MHVRAPISGLVLILAVLFPAVAGAAEVPLAPVTEGATAFAQYPDSGASDGNDYLFIWSDWRAGNTRRAARVTRDGVVLDRPAIPLPWIWDRNSVVWTGNSYLIVWGSSYPSQVMGLRLDRDGKIIDHPRVLKEGAYPTSVVSNGEHIVVAYRGYSDTAQEFPRGVMFLDADAHAVADFKLEQSATSAGMTSVAWNGTHFAAVWIDSVYEDPRYTMKGIRFHEAGTLDAEPRVLFEGTSTHFVATPSIASDGDTFITVTSDDGSRAFARRVSADLTAVGAPQLLPHLEYELLPQLNYSSPMIWTGSNYVLVGHDAAGITAVRLDREGRTVAADVIESIAGAANVNLNPVMTTNGRDLLVAWAGRSEIISPDAETDIFGTLVAASTLGRRNRTLLSISPQPQGRPLVASGGTNLLAVWNEGAGIYARRMTPDGTSIDATPVRLAVSGTPSAVVFDGRDYIVVWEKQTATRSVQDLVTVRVARDGPLRADGGVRMPNARPRAAASNGTVTLLVWDSGEKLVASRLGADATLLDSEPLVIEELGTGSVAVAASDKDFLVVWEAYGDLPYIITPPMSSVKVRGARVSPELVKRDAAGFDIAAAGYFEENPAVVWNGEKWLVVWASEHLPTAIRGRHVTPEGDVEGDAAGTVIVEHGRLPRLAWDGTRYFLAWQITHTFDPQRGPETSRMGWLPRLGSPLLYDRGLVSGYADVNVVALGPNKVGAAYARVVTEPAFGDVSRAYVNFVTLATKRRATR
jgi:hypothetical protein